MKTFQLRLWLSAAIVALSACQCGGTVLVKSGPESQPASMRDGGMAAGGSAGGMASAGGSAVIAGGSAGGSVSAGGTATAGGTAGPNWCASDCDCPTGSRCVSIGTELVTNECQAGGVNTCTMVCSSICPAGTQCTNGACVATPCTGANCTSTFPININGRYQTYYELDISEFAQEASEILKVLDLLRAIVSGTTTNCNQFGSLEEQLICYVGNLVSQQIQAPPWLGQLLQVLSDMFRFGNKPLKARGVMTLAEGQMGRVSAAEQWSELWLDYNGQVINVMNNPMLGANGRLTVTVLAFGGVRTTQEVILGPRRVEFDVNKLLVNLINVAISAGSNNQANDVGDLIDLALCSRINSLSTRLACKAIADDLADEFEIGSGLGGLRITEQRATIHDLDGNGDADSLGLPGLNMRGRITGEMSNGIASGDLGPFPKSSWYGTK